MMVKYKAYRGVAQLVECLVWDQDAAGSSPVTSTIFVQKQSLKYESEIIMDHTFFVVGLLVLNSVFLGLSIKVGKQGNLIKGKIYTCFVTLSNSILFAYPLFYFFKTEGIVSSYTLLYLFLTFSNGISFVNTARCTFKLIDRNCKNK